MKQITLSAILILFCQLSFAQENTHIPNKLNPPYQLNKAITRNNSVSADLPMARLTDKNANLKVYALPVDNMPCLVTDMSKVIPIPNAVAFAPINVVAMPNPLVWQQLIPTTDHIYQKQLRKPKTVPLDIQAK